MAEDAGTSGLHPRFTADLVGHEAAEREVLAAVASGRMPHAWLFTGPRGVGKATLAWRFARHLLAHSGESGGTVPSLFGDVPPPTHSFALDMEHPIFRRVAALGHGNLVVVERGRDESGKAVRGEIVVDDIRRLHGFFTRTGAEAGPRIAIVDSAGEMNRNAANALLKILEEPPDDALLLLVSHAPGRLLPTIRSRCRTLALKPLAAAEVEALLLRRQPELTQADAAALAALSEGAPGRAIALAEADGLAVYREIVGLLANLPGLDIPATHRLAEQLAGKAAEDRYRLFTDLLLDWVRRMVQAAARNAPEAEIVAGEATLRRRFAAALALDRWVELWEKMGRLVGRAGVVHLDRRQVILSLLGWMDEAVRGRMPG